MAADQNVNDQKMHKNEDGTPANTSNFDPSFSTNNNSRLGNRSTARARLNMTQALRDLSPLRKERY